MNPLTKSISLTHVQYISGDHVGRILAWSCLFPFIIIVALSTLVATRRELRTISLLAALLVGEAICLLLKHVIDEPRPAGCHLTSSGMPSSHTQFMVFFASYTTLFLSQNAAFQWATTRLLLIAGSIVAALATSYARIYLGYHTPWQVTCGALLGAVLAVIHYALYELLVSPVADTLVRSPLGRFLMLRDSRDIPNVLWFEYVTSLKASKDQRRKK